MSAGARLELTSLARGENNDERAVSWHIVALLRHTQDSLARDWERLFIGEIKAGRDPRRAPSRSVQVGSQIGNVAALLDAYWERCVKPAGLRSLGSVRSQIAVLKEHFGHLPVAGLEDADAINRFKTESDYAVPFLREG
jgi:hypothetical protein